MSKISAKRARSENKLSFLRVFITVLVFFVVLFIFLAGPRPIRKELAYRLKCNACLKSLGAAFKLYADDFDGSLPSVGSWCDALGKYILPGMLICPSSNARGDQSSYAMNEFIDCKKLAELSSDVVLLFECMPGWNKTGGPEILTTKYHKNEGCNVLFADGHVEFVRANKISELKWTISESTSDK
jgi:prepilin-type processing-associated H-X9-DG protein